MSETAVEAARSMSDLREVIADALDKAEWDATDDHLNNDRTYALMRADAIIGALRERGEFWTHAQLRETGLELVRASEQLRKAEKDREHLLNIVCSVPRHETSSSAMAAAYWNWLQTYAPAVNSARALQRQLESARDAGNSEAFAPVVAAVQSGIQKDNAK